jgi:hypothetical protein
MRRVSSRNNGFACGSAPSASAPAPAPAAAAAAASLRVAAASSHATARRVAGAQSLGAAARGHAARAWRGCHCVASRRRRRANRVYAPVSRLARPWVGAHSHAFLCRRASVRCWCRCWCWWCRSVVHSSRLRHAAVAQHKRLCALAPAHDPCGFGRLGVDGHKHPHRARTIKICVFHISSSCAHKRGGT